MTVYHFKVWPQYFGPILAREKTFEARARGGRDFQKGDVIILDEWDPTGDPGHEANGYTGRMVRARVLYVLDRWPGEDVPQFMDDDLVILAIEADGFVDWAPSPPPDPHPNPEDDGPIAGGR